MYNRGEGVTQDYTEAVKWCRKAAEQGNAGCQGILAIMYAIGRGVSKDGVSALMWLNIAAANGYKDENLERATKMLSASDLEKIQQRAKRCMASSYKDCD
jgi:TPR repeat protein